MVVPLSEKIESALASFEIRKSYIVTELAQRASDTKLML
jgi:hypothetical protein